MYIAAAAGIQNEVSNAEGDRDVDIAAIGGIDNAPLLRAGGCDDVASIVGKDTVDEV